MPGYAGGGGRGEDPQRRGETLPQEQEQEHAGQAPQLRDQQEENIL